MDSPSCCCSAVPKHILLIDAGADITSRTTIDLQHCILRRAGHSDMITQLVGGAPIESQVSGGFTALHIAVWHAQSDAIDRLLELKANVLAPADFPSHRCGFRAK